MASTVSYTLESKDLKGTEFETRVAMDVTNYEQANDIAPTAADLGLSRITSIVVLPRETTTLYAVWDGDVDTPVITLHNASDGLEAADATDHGVFTVIARGK